MRVPPADRAQALRKSLLETRRVELPAEEAPVFHPTLQQLNDPLAYIASLAREGHRSGIVKIVTPAGKQGRGISKVVLLGGGGDCISQPPWSATRAREQRVLVWSEAVTQLAIFGLPQKPEPFPGKQPVMLGFHNKNLPVCTDARKELMVAGSKFKS